jgi:histone acetyltransferase (RNA polymerase elongator complex component)
MIHIETGSSLKLGSCLACNEGIDENGIVSTMVFEIEFAREGSNHTHTYRLCLKCLKMLGREIKTVRSRLPETG